MVFTFPVTEGHLPEWQIPPPPRMHRPPVLWECVKYQCPIGDDMLHTHTGSNMNMMNSDILYTMQMYLI
jgi:hypothetical protein